MPQAPHPASSRPRSAPFTTPLPSRSPGSGGGPASVKVRDAPCPTLPAKSTALTQYSTLADGSCAGIVPRHWLLPFQRIAADCAAPPFVRQFSATPRSWKPRSLVMSS
ncbi:MAG: hypothetical protein ACK559_05075 [bacterium]